jgi:hypothetical protein
MPLGNFYTDTLSKDARFTSPARCADPLLLDPETRTRVQAIIAGGKAIGIELMIFETFRSQARQESLFKQGATKLKSVGVHGYGLACDLVKSINGEPSWKGDFSFLAKLARENGMISGLDWGEPNIKHTFIDADHVQQIPISRQQSLFAGTWYPTSTYDPYRDS